MFRESPLHKNAPLSAAVESDTVGYTTIEMQAGKWYQIGTPFVELEEGQTATLNTAFGQGFADNDLAYIYDSETNSYLGPYAWLTYNGQTGWWNTGLGVLCDTKLSPGQAVFIQKNTSSAVPFTGRVSATTPCSFGAESTSSWAQVACVYPEARTLNEMTWTNLEDGDQAYIYDSETNSYLGPYAWLTYNGQTGWWNTGLGVLCDTKLSPGQAVFIYKQSQGKSTLLPTVSGK